MEANLNLRMDKATIEKAKKYAREQGRSLSDLVQNYLMAVVKEPGVNYGVEEVSPFVKSMISDNPLPADFDYEEEYFKYLVEKHK